MSDIYSFVVNLLGPGLPLELHFLIPIGCILCLLAILSAVMCPFLMLVSLARR